MRLLLTTLSLLTVLNVFFWGFFAPPSSEEGERSKSDKKKDKTRSDIVDFNLFYFMPEPPMFDLYDGKSPAIVPNRDWDDPEFKEWVDLAEVP